MGSSSKKQEALRQENIEATNEAAPFNNLARGLGIKEEDSEVVLSMQEELLDEIVQVTAPPDLSDEAIIDFKTIIRASLGPILERSLLKTAKKIEKAQLKSMIDAKTLGLTEDSQIKRFLRTHGVDVDTPEDFEYLQRVFKEAIEFLNKNILKGKHKVNPKIGRIRSIDDIYKIFKCSAGIGPDTNIKDIIKHSCAILRIAAAINCVERDPLLSILTEAEIQLKELIGKHIKLKRIDGKLVMHYIPKFGDIPIYLEGVEMRTKERDRIIAKLLHKPSNSAEEVLDHIGLRFKTRTAIDTLRLIYYMFFNPETNIFPSTAIQIKESKNLILDSDTILEILNDPQKASALVTQLSEETIDHKELSSIVQTAENIDNPHSLPDYRSIMIIVLLPVVISKKDHKKVVKDFPIEIQFLDLESSLIDRRTHGSYIERQMKTVRERVLSNNLEDSLKSGSKKRKPKKTRKKK